MALVAGGYIILKPGWLFAKLISLDTLILGMYGIKLLIYSKLEGNIEHERSIINKSNNIFRHSLINRYIYYSALQLAYTTLCTLVNASSIDIIEYIGLLTIIPGLLNRVMELGIITKLIIIKQNITKILIAKLLSLIIKNGSQTFMNLEISIKDTELQNVIYNYDEAKSIFFQLLINAGTLCVLSLVETFAPRKWYYQVATAFYNYKVGPSDKLETVVFGKINGPKQIENFKDQIKNMVSRKQWKTLISANTLKILYLLYINRSNTSNELSRFIDGFLVAGFWTSLTLSFSGWLQWINPTSSSSIVPIALSMIITFLKDDDINIKKIMAILVGGVIGYFLDIVIATCLLCEYAHLIIFNKITFSISKYSVKKIGIELKRTFEQNVKYIAHLIPTSMVYILIDTDNTAFFPMIFILNFMPLLLSYHEKLVYIQLMPLLFGYSSYYNKVHMGKIFLITLVTTPMITNNLVKEIKRNTLNFVSLLKPSSYGTRKNTKNIPVINVDVFSDSNFLNIITNSNTIEFCENDKVDRLNIVENYVEEYSDNTKANPTPDINYIKCPNPTPDINYIKCPNNISDINYVKCSDNISDINYVKCSDNISDINYVKCSDNISDINYVKCSDNISDINYVKCSDNISDINYVKCSDNISDINYVECSDNNKITYYETKEVHSKRSMSASLPIIKEVVKKDISKSEVINVNGTIVVVFDF